MSHGISGRGFVLYREWQMHRANNKVTYAAPPDEAVLVAFIASGLDAYALTFKTHSSSIFQLGLTALRERSNDPDKIPETYEDFRNLSGDEKVAFLNIQSDVMKGAGYFLWSAVPALAIIIDIDTSSYVFAFSPAHHRRIADCVVVDFKSNDITKLQLEEYMAPLSAEDKSLLHTIQRLYSYLEPEERIQL